MNIHEYQAKELLRRYGINIPLGYTATSMEEIEKIVSLLNEGRYVIKAQIHAGGRGKGGGVKIAHSVNEIIPIAQSILGMQLVTPQTSAEGRLVRRIYIEPAVNIISEFYMSMMVDRELGGVTLIASSEGGMSIEEVAEKDPSKILRLRIPFHVGFQDFHGRRLVQALGLSSMRHLGIENLCKKLYQVFVDKDASLIEINPLVLTEDMKLIPLDAKISFDSNALYRHPDIRELRDLTEEDPKEVEASSHDLNYIALDGSIGCMVNGAGLAMATMDIIKLHGGSPANFLDVGGGATKDRVQAAFKIILSDPKVKGIFVNIFGGIMRCDIIAQGIVDAANEMQLNVPVVVRLQGTNVDLGKDILAKSGLSLEVHESLSDAAKAIINATKG
jgi:succinyl-CoA synthetase beta subunit